MCSGRLKVFNTLPLWLAEFRLYRRDDKGKIVKKNDHLMDATRYLAFSGLDYATTKPMHYSPHKNSLHYLRDSVTGY